MSTHDKWDEALEKLFWWVSDRRDEYNQRPKDVDPRVVRDQFSYIASELFHAKKTVTSAVNADEMAWLRRFIVCSVFGPPEEEVQRAIAIIDRFAISATRDVTGG